MKPLPAQSEDRLTEILARELLGWKVGPDRFLTTGRSWIPKARFNPFRRFDDAFLLLNGSGATCTLTLDLNKVLTAEVRIGERVGRSAGEPKARTVTLAIVRTLDLEALP